MRIINLYIILVLIASCKSTDKPPENKIKEPADRSV